MLRRVRQLQTRRPGDRLDVSLSLTKDVEDLEARGGRQRRAQACELLEQGRLRFPGSHPGVFHRRLEYTAVPALKARADGTGEGSVSEADLARREGVEPPTF